VKQHDFFLNHGAKSVICIESDNNAYSKLLDNAFYHRDKILPYHHFFKLVQFKMFNFDFMKMDIEGYEEILLKTKLSKPSVIEIHGLQLRDKFQKQEYRIVNCAMPLSFAYWKC
jgi:hypothetical protein